MATASVGRTQPNEIGVILSKHLILYCVFQKCVQICSNRGTFFCEKMLVSFSAHFLMSVHHGRHRVCACVCRSVSVSVSMSMSMSMSSVVCVCAVALLARFEIEIFIL